MTGRPPHRPTPESRRRCLAYARKKVPKQYIAILLHITEKTLNKHYKAELGEGGADFAHELRGVLYELAIVQKIPAMVAFACKTQLGDREADKLPEPAPDPNKKPDTITVHGGLPKGYAK